MRVGLATFPTLVAHDTGPGHPERPDRLRAIHRAIRQAELISSADPFPHFEIDLRIERQGSHLIELAVSLANRSDAALVHPDHYLDRITAACAAGLPLDPDTPTCPASEAAAYLSLGCVLAAADAVARGEVDRAFAAVRPPGHHAEPNRPMGFCLLSNVAIAVRHLQSAHGFGKIAIVDFDVHHGNGTQAAFYEDPSVLFISMHQDPRTLYPHTGLASETGRGAGLGTTLNLPLPPGSGDGVYHRTMEQSVLPAIEAFRPEILFISAGFDAHADDPLAQMRVTDDGFAMITRMLAYTAANVCGGRIVSALEGGYDLPALGRGVVRHLIELCAE